MSTNESSEQLTPVLTGTLGWVAGEVYVLKADEQVVLGRSRSCDISLRRIARYLERPPGERDADHDFNTVSRRHLRLTVNGTTATLEDLSTNGSYANETLFTGRTEVDLDNGPTTIRLGTRETLRLELASPERIEAIRAEAGAFENADTSGSGEPDADGDAGEGTATASAKPDPSVAP